MQTMLKCHLTVAKTKEDNVWALPVVISALNVSGNLSRSSIVTSSQSWNIPAQDPRLHLIVRFYLIGWTVICFRTRAAIWLSL